MNEKQLEQLGRQTGFQFLPCFDELTTSDLQASIDAELMKQGLTTAEMMVASEIALQYIYQKVKERG